MTGLGDLFVCMFEEPRKTTGLLPNVLKYCTSVNNYKQLDACISGIIQYVLKHTSHMAELKPE